MKSEEIIQVLDMWNIWNKDIDFGKPRHTYVDTIAQYLDMRHILILKGIRRCGKTTIAKQLMKFLIDHKVKRKQILYVNFEDMHFADKLSVTLLEEIFQAYLTHTKNKGKTYFFLDEVQRIPNWERWIRTKYDQNQNMKFIVTGSSAHLLDRELSTLLTGRNLSFEIMPLSYREFKTFNRNAKIEEYFHYGGFPEVVLQKSEEKKKQILNQYFFDIVHRDIVDRHKIRNSQELFALAKYLVSSPGSKSSINKLSKVFGITQNTIALYISYMIDAYLLLEVRFFSFSAKKRHDVMKLPKYYVIDNGLVSITNPQYSKNKGMMYENTVFLKLHSQKEKLDSIMYWSDLKSEVDFIVQRKAVNVTSTDDIPEREFIGLEQFSKKHKRFTTLLVSQSTKKDNVIPIVEFLLSDTREN